MNVFTSSVVDITEPGKEPVNLELIEITQTEKHKDKKENHSQVVHNIKYCEI